MFLLSVIKISKFLLFCLRQVKVGEFNRCKLIVLLQVIVHHRYRQWWNDRKEKTTILCKRKLNQTKTAKKNKTTDRVTERNIIETGVGDLNSI